jgi:V/A-type H+-transporting ATPase subunit A
MSTNAASVVGVYGNMICAKFTTSVKMNEVAYIEISAEKEITQLKAEVIRVRGTECDLQVFEDSRKAKVGDKVVFSRELLSIELGPGLLNNVYDGLANPLEELALKAGFFLKRGFYLKTINRSKKWDFTPIAKAGDVLKAGDCIGFVDEGSVKHRVMIPFSFLSKVRVLSVVPFGSYLVDYSLAEVEGMEDCSKKTITMVQTWPVKKAIKSYREKLLPNTPLTTKVRIVDALFPIAEGGSACIPGPFGSGKTVFQQSVSKFCDAEVVIVAACGERAGEVVETLKEFPTIKDPKTGKSLMERTIIICNTSSMPVAAREASVYTAVTMAEYYRQMGIRVLLLADSTSRWAQALREMSGRLEEIPGEEAFPAYLGSLVSAFYERAGLVLLSDTNLGEARGSVTIMGTVSPAGGNFEEPVTQSTLAVVGCFLGLTYSRSYAKRFPAIAPLDSWSKYLDIMSDSLNNLYYENWVSDIKELLTVYSHGQKNRRSDEGSG